MWNLKIKTKQKRNKQKTSLIQRTDQWLPEALWGWDCGKIGEGSQKVQTASYEMSPGMQRTAR